MQNKQLTAKKKQELTMPYIQKIIEALGNKISATDKQKSQFAKIILLESPLSYHLGELHHEQKDAFKSLKKKIDNAEKSFRELEDALLRNIDTEYICSLISQKIWRDYESNMSLDIVLLYLEECRRQLSVLKPLPRKSGRNNYGALSITKMIAIQYLKSFNRMPTSGGYNTTDSKNYDEFKVVETPFDRVCIVVGRFIDKKIRPETRIKAIEFVRINCTNKKSNNSLSI